MGLTGSVLCLPWLLVNYTFKKGAEHPTDTELIYNLLDRTERMAEKEQEMVNRPDNTAFTQQRLPAWQPMLSAGIVIPGFVLIGLAFIGIGVALFVTSRSITVLEV